MLIIYDGRIPEEYIAYLKKELPRATFHPLHIKWDESKVYRSILCHPDIYYSQIDEDTIVHAPSLGEEHLRGLSARGVTLVEGKMDPGGIYPGTASYNILKVGSRIFHNLDITDPAILEIAREKQFELINVKQGYAKCSSIVSGENSIITSDMGIYNAAMASGVDVLFVEPGKIMLPGEKNGFIGGVSGIFPGGKKLIIAGDVSTHPEGARMYEFFTRYAIELVELKGFPLFDGGGFIVV